MTNGFILTGDYSTYEKEMTLLKEMFQKIDISVEFIDFNDITVIATDDFDGQIYVKGEKVNCPEFVIVSTVDERDEYKLRAVLRMFETLGVNCVNSMDAIDNAGDKIYSFQLAKQLVPEVKIPKTMLLTPDVSLDMIDGEIGFPLILKIMDGNQGRGVCLIETKEELNNILNIITSKDYGQPIMVQEAISSSKGRDIRVIVVGGEVITSFVRFNDKDFKSNIHQGGTLKEFEAPEVLINTSIKLANAFNLQIGSIDYLFGENDDEFFLCELNSIPGLSYLFNAKENGDYSVIQRFTKSISNVLS